MNSPARTPGSTPSSASHPVSTATDSKTNSVDKIEPKPVKKDSIDKGVSNFNVDRTGGGSKTSSLDKKEENVMIKSSDFSEFDSMMTQSVTSIASDIVIPMKRNGKYTKNKKDSPLHDRKESPARQLKNKEREVTESKEYRNDSPSRYRKNSKESPVSKRKHRKQEVEPRGAKRLSTDMSENKEPSAASANRLSGVGGNANNNIFYLIDPTVKNKCKSVGDVAAANRKSADFSKDAQKGKQVNS